jgi:subtilisin-like proprotein convertase family protein
MNQLCRRALTTGPMMLLALAVTAGVSHAEVNRTPIAIPLIGTEQVASPYPSSITVAARGGAEQTGDISVVLHGVTHPCPADLSVVLVHDDTKYLLLNNVGGCRPMQGTTIEFVGDVSASMIPTFPPVGAPPFPEYMRVAASFAGPQPTPPAPFPSGGFIVSGFPPSTVRIDGQWDLYVIDKVAGNRGVIAGGWSISHDAVLRSDFRQVTLIPRGQFTSGPAQVYPIRFDLSQAREDLRAEHVSLKVDFAHQKPDDMTIVLQSPSGTAVMLLANAGGAINLPGATITFDDGAVNRPPNNGPIPNSTSLFYLPTEWPEAVPASVPAPGPQPPYRNALFAFNGESVRGVWTLWVADDAQNGTGLLAQAELSVRTAFGPLTDIQGHSTTSTSTQPFVHIVGNLGPVDRANGHVTWRVTNGNAFYAAGAFNADPTTGAIVADIPVKRGTNIIEYRGWNSGFGFDVHTATVNVNELTYSLAEGATSDFFHLDVTLANPGAANAPIRVDLLPEGGAVLSNTSTAPAASPLPIAINALLPNASLSTVVHSLDAVPLAVERTMIWDQRGYGGHGGGATSPAMRWLFAEGAQGFFQTYVLLANDNPTPVNATIRFLLEGGGVVTLPVTVAPRTRRTIFAGDIDGLKDRSFGIDITANAPIIAERAMYFSANPNHTYDGGHESAGVNEPSTRWFLAEGATGAFFDCFVLLSNPNPTAALVTLTYLLPDGRTIPQTITVAANSRRTINVERVDPRLADAAVSTIIASTVGIVAERAMYWPDSGQGWREAHNSFGLTEAGLRWAVADGRIGGPRGYQTYILLANPNPAPAEVQVTFHKGAGVTATRTYTLPPTSRVNIEPGSDIPQLGAGTFSAEIEVLNFQPIAVEKAMYWNADGETWAAGTNVTATRFPPK